MFVTAAAPDAQFSGLSGAVRDHAEQVE